MTPPVRIECADVTVTVTAPVEKRCPVRNEADSGTLTITYQTHGAAIELHSLAEYLRTFTATQISHEDFTKKISEFLSCRAVTEWETAGLRVRCEHSVLR